MKKGLILSTVLVVLALLLAGCTSSPGTATTGSTSSTVAVGNGYVNIVVTDAPPSNNVTSIMVTVSSISVHMAGTETNTAPPATTTSSSTATATTTTAATTTGTTPPASSEEGGQWITIPLSGANPFDLLKLQGVNELLGRSQLQAGRYTQIRLEISKVGVALGGGTLQEATVPSGELKFVRPFDVIAGVTTDIKLDFDAQKSVNVTGSSKIIVNPVVKLSISNESSNQIASVAGAVSAVGVQASTVTILPTGQTQPVVLGVTPQTILILNGAETTLADLAALPSGDAVTASYYSNSLKAVRIEVETLTTTTTV